MLIGIAGKAGTGKSTAAILLATHYSLKIKPLAHPLKLAISHLMPGAALEGPSKELVDARYGISPRAAMQDVGTAIRKLNPDFFCQSLGTLSFVVVPDVRYENEATFIRSNGGLLIHILRSSTLPVREHKSESGITVYERDFVIHNDGTLNELHAALAQAIAEWRT